MKKICFLSLLMLMSVMVFAKKEKSEAPKNMVVKVYAYGTATCFNDTLAYMTDVIEIDSAFYVPDTKFIGGRDSYSRQLQKYFTDKGMERRCCTFYYYPTREKAEKAYVKLRRRIQVKDHLEVVQLPADEFSYKSERPSEYILDPALANKPAPEKKKRRPEGPGPNGGSSNGRPSGPPPGGMGGMPSGMGPR